MKKTKRLLSFILASTMVATSAVFTANAAASSPEYLVDLVYDVDAKTATATISITGDSYRVGRFGFGYNTEVLTLVNKDGDEFDASVDKMADVVVGVKADEDYTVITTEETNTVSDLINTEDGTIAFAWYANAKVVDNADKGVVDAENGAALATVTFAISDEILEAANPADAFIATKNLLVVLDKDAASDVPGYTDLYVAQDDNGDKAVSDKRDVDTAVSTNVSAPNVKAPTSTSSTDIELSWPAADEDEPVASYTITVYNKNGDVVAEKTVEATEDNLDSKGRYNVEFTDEDGIEKNKTYNITITPTTANGNTGNSKTVTVKTQKQSAISPAPGGSSSTSGGATLTYTVTYLGGEGTIPEGQKFKYQVERNGYVSGSPAVVAPEGKVFAGWSVDGVTLISVEVYKITKDIAFKAIFVEKEEDTHRPFILGYPGGAVRADDSLTRAEAATIIARASGKFDETKTYDTVYFSDVKADHWAYKYIAFVYENNIVNGYENGTFAPDNKITRAEFATIMQRYLALPLNENEIFSDVKKDNWAIAYIGACKNAGLISGYENGEFRPANNITRAEAVKILNRAADRVPTPASIDAYIAEKGIPFEDLAEDKWYFYEIMEAAFPHLISYYH